MLGVEKSMLNDALVDFGLEAVLELCKSTTFEADPVLPMLPPPFVILTPPLCVAGGSVLVHTILFPVPERRGPVL